MSAELRVNVQVARRFDVSPRRLFDAWTDPRKVREWLATPPLSLDVVDLELKARAGRRFALALRRADRSVSYLGECVEAVTGQRLVFTWVDTDVSKETTLVSVAFHAIPSAWTTAELRVDHARVMPQDERRTEARWKAALEALAVFVAKKPLAM